jgi:hypothetical protein
MFPEDPPLEHFGIKGMRWGVRREELSSDIQGKAKSKASTTLRKASREYETMATVATVGALGVAYLNSHRAQVVMKTSTKYTARYMAKRENRKKVYRVIRKAGILYARL